MQNTLQLLEKVMEHRQRESMVVKIGDVEVMLYACSGDRGRMSIGSKQFNLPLSPSEVEAILVDKEETVDVNYDFDATYRIPLTMLQEVADADSHQEALKLLMKHPQVDVSADDADFYLDDSDMGWRDFKEAVGDQDEEE